MRGQKGFCYERLPFENLSLLFNKRINLDLTVIRKSCILATLVAK